MSNKILIVSTEFPPLPGGIGNHAYNLARELADAKFEVTVLTEKREAHSGDWENLRRANANLQICGIARNRIIFVTYLLRLWRFFTLTGRNSFRAVIFSGKFAVWLNGILPKANSIAVIHGSEIKQNGVSRFVFVRGLKNAGQIVCVSNYTKKQLLKSYPFLEENKITVINNGFRAKKQNAARAAKEKPESRLNLVTVGGIHRRKGQFNVVKALPDLIKVFPHLKYHIVGLPVEKRELQLLISDLGLDEKVEFHHNLSDSEVENVLRGADIFLMLSEHLGNGDFEGFGIAIIEAMSLGLPAIGSQNSGIADAVADDYSGKLVDPHSVGEVVNAVEKIVSNYTEFSGNATKWANKFRWSEKIGEYRNLIEKL